MESDFFGFSPKKIKIFFQIWSQNSRPSLTSHGPLCRALGTWGVLLHILVAMVSQRGLLAAFGSKTLVLGGLGLFFEENGLCEARYVSKIGKVHTPRIQQIVFLNAWHLSRTLTQRLVKPFPNNLSKTAEMASILASKCGGAQASG